MEQQCRRRPGLSAKSILLTGSAIALVGPLLQLTLRGSITLREFLSSLFAGWLFSNSIALLATVGGAFLIPRVRSGWGVKGPLLAGILLAAAVAGSLFSSLVLAAVGMHPWIGFWTVYWQSLRIAVFFTFTFGLGSWAVGVLSHRLQQTTLELRTQQLERERAEKLATEARLSSLESRIHPHFLFNALNSISSLIRDDPEQAERTVERMAALLRFSLDSARVGQVPLGQEIKIVRDYLEIEKVRFGERLRYDISVPTALDGVLVPPMSVQTLVENSIKYAVAPRRGGGTVSVRADSFERRLEVEVRDDGPGFALDSVPPGHGVDNLRSRLEAMYGSAARLEVRCAEGGTSVRLTVPVSGSVAVA